MKPIIIALFIFSFALAGSAAENPVDTSAVKNTSEAQKPEIASPTPLTEKTASKAPEIQPSEPKLPSPVDVKPEQAKAVPAESSPVPGSNPKEPLPVSSPAVSTSLASSKAEAPAPLVGCVAPLQSLIDFHEKELANVKQIIARWNSKVGLTLKDRQALEQDLMSKQQKVAELQATSTKAGKKEASLLKKDISKINKAIQAVDKELKAHRKSLTEEIQILTRDSQQGVKETCSRVLSEIQKSGN